MIASYANRMATNEPGAGDRALPAELEFSAVKLLPASYPRVMGMLVGLSASTGGDLFATIRARPQANGALLIVVPMPDGTAREIQVPAGDWAMLPRDQREQSAPPAAFDLHDRRRRG